VAQFMEFGIGEQHALRDPGAILTALAAPFHDLLERVVPGEFEITSPESSAQAPRDVKLLRLQDGARVRRPPEHRFVRSKPWEDTISVGRQESVRREFSADGNEITVRVKRIGEVRGTIWIEEDGRHDRAPS
jgi:hypothetical protein